MKDLEVKLCKMGGLFLSFFWVAGVPYFGGKWIF